VKFSDHQRTQPTVGLAAAAVPAAVPRREPERTNAANIGIPRIQRSAHAAHPNRARFETVSSRATWPTRSSTAPPSLSSSSPRFSVALFKATGPMSTTICGRQHLCITITRPYLICSHYDNLFHTLIRCARLVSLMVNTLYSFYWDVVHDWDLGHANATHPMLRDQLVFRSPAIYYGIMAINFMLRFSWSVKLSSHIRLHDELRYWLHHRLVDSLATARSRDGVTFFLLVRCHDSMFIFEVAEVLRRWLWIYLRSENQFLKDEKGYRARLVWHSESQLHGKLGASADDIL